VDAEENVLTLITDVTKEEVSFMVP
jgi:hypothetical protein